MRSAPAALRALYENYLRPLLAEGLLADLDSAGELGLSLEYRAEGEARLALALRDVFLEASAPASGQQRPFGFQGLNASLVWNRDPANAEALAAISPTVPLEAQLHEAARILLGHFDQISVLVGIIRTLRSSHGGPPPAARQFVAESHARVLAAICSTDGFTTNAPSMKPMRTAPIGPPQGMSAMVSAVLAPRRLRTSR